MTLLTLTTISCNPIPKFKPDTAYKVYVDDKWEGWFITDKEADNYYLTDDEFCVDSDIADYCYPLKGLEFEEISDEQNPW